MKSRIINIFMLFVLLISLFSNTETVSPVRALPAQLPVGLTKQDWAQLEGVLSPVQQAYLKASNTEDDDHFGWAIAASEDTIVVGAPYEDSKATGINGDWTDNSGFSNGAAYVFKRINGVWSQEAYLKGFNTRETDKFGISVAISGNTIVIGAENESSNAKGVNGIATDYLSFSSGAVYIFIRSGNTWTQQAYLKSSNSKTGDNFGHSVSISGDTVVVGADNESSNAIGVNGNQTNIAAPQSGAAYVFTRTGTTWSQQAYLKASNTDSSDHFGQSVSVSGNSIVVGALFEASNATGVNADQGNNSIPQAGAAYVFSRTGNTWSQQAYLKASNSQEDDGFGWSVAISNNTIVVGAHFEDSGATGVNGNINDNSAIGAGAAYVFSRSGSTWSQQAYLKPSNTDSTDNFGTSVAISEDTIIIGAAQEDSGATSVNGDQGDTKANSGAVYMFIRNGSTWNQQAYLKASNSGSFDYFGHSVSISGNTIVVGTYLEDSSSIGVNGAGDNNLSPDSGAAYAFYLTPTASFSDVPLTYWASSYIERLFNAGITGGCGTGIYCPDNSVTRAQMAIFLLKGIHGSSYAPPAVGGSTGFGDVTTNYWAAAWIKQLAAEGITGGCGGGNYCPDNTVTRAQMAVFLMKAKNGSSYSPPAVGGNTGFSDVATDYWAAAFIKQLVADSITAGCGNGNYCPEDSVTRAQMAVFLVKAFNLP